MNAKYSIRNRRTSKHFEKLIKQAGALLSDAQLHDKQTSDKNNNKKNLIQMDYDLKKIQQRLEETLKEFNSVQSMQTNQSSSTEK